MPVFGTRPSQLVNPGPFRHRPFLGGYAGPQGPPGIFLGWWLLAAEIASVAVWHRSRLVCWTATAGVVAWALSLGIMPLGNFAWLPWRLFALLPVASDILPLNFAVLVQFAAALLLGLSLGMYWDHRASVATLLGETSARIALARAARRWVDVAWGALCVTVALGVIAPIAATYGVPYAVSHARQPGWFKRKGRLLHGNPSLLVMPYPSSGDQQAMVWQAQSQLAFAMAGGYAFVPGRNGRTSIYRDPLGGATAILNDLSQWAVSEPSAAPQQTREVRRALSAWHVSVLVVAPQDPRPGDALGFLTATLGRLPRWQDGVWVWYGLGSHPPVGLVGESLAACAKLLTRDSLATPECVLERGSMGRTPPLKPPIRRPLG